MNTEPEIKKFETEDAAAGWMYEKLEDEDCIDNYRFAFKDEPAAMEEFEAKSSDGCCGSYEEDVEVAGRPAVIGCNYGH